MMDTCSSNASSVTSFDLESDQQEVAEKPLSPVLSTSKINRRVFLDRKVNKQKSKIKLASKFNEDIYSNIRNQNVHECQNASTVGQMQAGDVYEEQRKRYYELLCDDSTEDIYKERQYSSGLGNEYSAIRQSPIHQDIHNKLHDESIETMVNHHCNENVKTVRFSTASGKCIDISDDSLRTSSEIFEDISGFQDGEGLNDYSVFKDPTLKNKHSKIPISNQNKKNIIKTKATRSTYEEIQINVNDFMVTQTQVDCFEDFIQNDNSNDYSMSNTDSGGTGPEATITDSMNKIFSNKRFMEFSSSSVENGTYSDTFVEVTDVFNYKPPKAINNNPVKVTNRCEKNYKPNLENVVDEDWSDTKHVQTPNREQMRKIALAQFKKPCQEDVHLNIKNAKREMNLSPQRKSQQQEMFENNNVKCKNNEAQQIPIRGNATCQKLGPGEEVNIDAATSKNLVIVTMAPPVTTTNGDGGENPYRSIVELHRNTNFNHSYDSVQNLGIPRPTDFPENRKKVPKEKKHQEGFLGFTPEEQQQAKKTFIKVSDAVERTDQSIKVEKKKNEKKLKKKKKDQDKVSLEVARGNELEEKSLKKDKIKHSKIKKDGDAMKEDRENAVERKSKSRNTSVIRRNEPTHDMEVGDGMIKQEEIKTITYDHLSIVAEKCKKLSSHNKRKGPSEIIPVNCSELTPKDNENQTIALSPNQKKFKIEIDCNSKFRINISCNGDTEAVATKAIQALGADNRTLNEDNLKGNSLAELSSQICLDKVECPSECDLQLPKGKMIKKFISKAQKLYRDMKSSDTNITEKKEDRADESLKTADDDLLKFPQIPNKDVKFSNKRIKIKKRNDSVNGSDPNYEDISEPAKEFVEFSGFKTAGGKGIKFSDESLKKAKKTYENTFENQDIVEETNKEPVMNLGFKTAGGKDLKLCERAVSKAKKIYEHFDTYMEELNENCRNNANIQKDIKVSEKTLNKAKKLFQILAAEQMNAAAVAHADVVTKEEKVDKVMNRVNKLYESLNNDHNENIGVKLDNIQNVATTAMAHIYKNQSDQLEQKINESCKPKFDLRNCGFVSASGHHTVISDKAMNKANKMFENVVKEGEGRQMNETHQGPVMEEPTKDRKKPKGQILNVNNENNLWNNVNGALGFQTGSGEKIDVTSKGIKKATGIFGDLSFQAGDFDTMHHDKKYDSTLYDTDSLTTAQLYHQMAGVPDFCMGDFIPSSENTAFEKNLPAEGYGEPKIQSGSPEAITTLDSKTSKKAFELLKDVVVTVDQALQSIDEKFKRPRLSVSKKRLGMSKFKQINIPTEKLERAKLLFKEDLNSTVLNMKGITKPIKISQPVCSTPVLKPQRCAGSTNNQSSAKEQSMHRTVTADILTSSILICERTKGTVEDWFSLIDDKLEFVRMQLKDLEEKKAYLTYQKEVLEKTKSDVISPQPGILIRQKEHVKLHLRDLKTNNYFPGGISEHIICITPQNAENVHFTFDRASSEYMNLYTTLDGALVVPNMHNIIGCTEIELAFKTMPGVDTNLIPHGWFENHYKLVVWKLASYERFLSAHLRGCLTVENVMQQIKYRYDREIDRAERPVVRKILEKDDIPQKRIVWCVSNIDEVNKNEIELTDGWYCVRTVIDEGIVSLVNKDKIKLGSKLVTTGAQLLNCEGCHPLEVPANVRLKISFNSTRRAQWYAKLGYQKFTKPLLIPLHSIRADGGMIGCIKFYIARIYPLRFMEQIGDTKIWRNNKAEEKRAREFENERLSKMEKVHYEVQMKYEQERLQEKKDNFIELSKLSKAELMKITCPQTLLSLLECSNDPDALMEYLSPSQRASVLDYRQTVCMQRQHEVTKKIAEEMEKLKLAKRKVVSILKLLVLDATCESDKAYQFCVWNPCDEDLTLLREYNVYYAFNILPRFNGELFSTNKTSFKVDKKMSHNKFKRQAYPIAMLLDSHYRPSFNEFDVVGIIIYVNMAETEQSMWLGDFLGNLLFIKVRDGPKFCRLLDDAARGDVVSVQNLLYCPPQPNFGVAIANQFTIVTKSMQNYLRECMEMFKLQLPKDLTKFLGECTAKIERSTMRMDVQSKGISDTPFFHCGLKLTPNMRVSLDDTSEESAIIPQKLTATDIAMSLIDTDQFI